MNELYHHGIKGQRWGIRRYQFSDGSLTPDGQKRYGNKTNYNNTMANKVSNIMNSKVKYTVDSARTRVTGKQYVDGYLSKGTKFARIQTSKEFENFAFYATYKKKDTDKYLGLFGKNLTSRAEKEAKLAEEKSNATGDIIDITKAKELRTRSDNLKVYQLKLDSTKKLKIPSDKNASHITVNLLKEKEFKENVIASIKDSKEKMKRPQQQILFNQAQKALNKDPDKMTSA